LKTLWTTLSLPHVSSDTLEVFFCEYGHDVPARRQRLLEELQSRNGGPLSIQSVRKLVIRTKNLKATQAHWQKLLDPIQASSQNHWRVGSGPAIHLSQAAAEPEGIQSLVIHVKSLEQAHRFLKEQGLLGIQQPGTLTLSSTLLQGLNITLVPDRSDAP
jgi:hypothetical protein